jgi:hypothetical protein
MNYDPNKRDGVHTVRVTLQTWEYKGYVDLQCGGNCKGKSILDLVEDFTEDEIVNNNCSFKFVDDGEAFKCVLFNGVEELEIEEEINAFDDLIVGLEIISFE